MLTLTLLGYIVMMSAEHVTILYFVCTVYCVLYVAEQRTVRLVSKHQPGAELAGQHWGMDHFSCCHLNFMLWKLRYNTEMLHLNFIKGVCEWFIVFHPARDTWSHNTGCYRVFLWGTLFWLLSLTYKESAADEVQLIPYYLSMLFVRPGQARAEAGTMSSLENYKWVYLAFQRRLRVTRISRYGYRGIFIVMSSHDPALQLNSALVQAGAPLSSLLSWFIKIPGLGWEVRQPSGHSVLGRNKEIWISNFGITNFTVMHLHNVLK